ncbi:hypothetical protein [Povalibacter sp.]|uniref:hypothetical protein n=1 Tax=Povalibacter sp. TaxID=1962978 RepID=UPI002D1FBA6D|nr:hypothetical protein [Povalibacter sp.]
MDLEWLKRNEAGFRAYNERAEAWPFKPDLPLLPEDDHDIEHLRRLLTAGQDSPLDSEMDSLLAKIRRRLRAGNEADGSAVDPHLQRDPDAP